MSECVCMGNGAEESVCLSGTKYWHFIIGALSTSAPVRSFEKLSERKRVSKLVCVQGRRERKRDPTAI